MYLMETYDVDYPGTEPCSSRGFLSYKVRVEFWVTEVLVFHTPHCGLRDMLFVKIHQSLQEVIHLDEHVCAKVCGLARMASHYNVHTIQWHLEVCER